METVIAKYTPTFSVLAGATTVLKTAPRVLAISERVKGVTVEQIPLQLYILLQVKVLGRGEVFKKGIV